MILMILSFKCIYNLLIIIFVLFKCKFILNILIYYKTNYLLYFRKDNEFIIDIFYKELY